MYELFSYLIISGCLYASVNVYISRRIYDVQNVSSFKLTCLLNFLNTFCS